MITPFSGYKVYDETSFFERNRIAIVASVLIIAVAIGFGLPMLLFYWLGG